MGKKGGTLKRSSKSTKTRKDIVEDQYDDEIDAFHKQRDIVPLDVNDDTDESDEDDVQPVFDLQGVDDESEEDEDTEDEEEAENGLTAKMIRQKKYLRAKFGDGDDEMADDDKDKEEDKRSTWGGRSGLYHSGDNVDFDILSSDDEDIKAEEEEVIRLRAEQLGSITAADAGLDDDSEEDSDRELTMEEISDKGKQATKSITDKKEKGDKDTHVEEIKKDINSLSKEEQMDVVYSSAPEIVGLLSELNDAVEELESKINPVMNKIKELDEELPPGFEESLARSIANGAVQKVVKEDQLTSPVSDSVDRITQDTAKVEVRILLAVTQPMKIDNAREEKKKKGEKRKHQNDLVDVQSEEMLKLRAALEGKLRTNGVLGSTVSKSDKAQKRQKLANRKLETFDDYVDDADNSTHNVTADKLTKLVSTKRKPKTISGDDDLPQRDDIGERRRKFELRVLAGAGVKSSEGDGRNKNGAFASDDEDDNDGDNNDMVDNDGESEDEFYKQVKQKQQAKRAAKAEIYSR
nr:unknown protein [Arabidopsis thaliana]